MKVRVLFAAASGVAFAALGSGVAVAQTSDTSEVQEVTVTGSRIRRNTDTPSPVTVQTVEEMKLAAPNTLGEALNQLPSFKGGTPSKGSYNSANIPGAGGNIISLRGLGPARTLLLLDGRRFVPTNALGSTDVNVIPSSVVSRVEVVTGGASAAYGSDAVSGVVNFILDTKFRGLKGEISTGLSSRGDFPSYKIELAAGTDFAEEKGRAIATVDFYRLENPGDKWGDARPWSRTIDNFITNPVPGQRPVRLRCGDTVLSSASFGGLITSGPLKGIEFGPGGVPRQHDFGPLAGSLYQCGGSGDLDGGGIGASLNPQISGFGHVEYDVTPNTTFFVEGNYSHEVAETWQYYVWHFPGGANTLNIQPDNAFLPESVRQQMLSQGLTSFPLGRIDADYEGIYYDTTVNVGRIVAGLKGEVGPWSYNLYGTYGKSRYKVSNNQNINEHNYFAAVDSVRDPATGQIVCRSTLQGFDTGCVPFNPFGQGSPSLAANLYVRGESLRDLHYTQKVLSFDVQREVFDLGAGPISVAFGAEYRKEHAHQETDPISSSTLAFPGIRGVPASLPGKQGGFVIGNPLPFDGSFSVREAFVETVVPILKDVPGFKYLELNAAARVTDYSTSGGVTTWKIGASYMPFEDLRFRVTRSRDIRAPNTQELFSQGVGNAGAQIIQPVTRQPIVMQGLLGAGNPDLQPERANTLTAGLVYQPRWAPGFDIVLDYYDIGLTDAIGLLNPQVTADECILRNNPQACSVISAISPSAILWTQRYLNISKIDTRGVDIEVGYTRPLWGGDASARVIATYLDKLRTTDPGVAPREDAGVYNRPKWSTLFRLSYTRAPWTVFTQVNYLGGGKVFATFVKGVDIDDNSVAPIAYTDLTVKYDLSAWGRDWETFLTINNVFDQAPPWYPQQAASIIHSTDYMVYDAIGRYFTAGVRFKF